MTEKEAPKLNGRVEVLAPAVASWIKMAVLPLEEATAYVERNGANYRVVETDAITDRERMAAAMNEYDPTQPFASNH